MLHKNVRGLTILELMASIAIIAITCALSIPSLAGMFSSREVKNISFDLVKSINISKQEAITQSEDIFLCPSSDGASCELSDWSTGWIAFVDSNNSNSYDANEKIIISNVFDKSNLSINTSPTISNGIAFSPDGTLNFFSAQMIVICDDQGFTRNSRALVLTYVGYSSIYPAKEAGATSCQG